MTILNLNPGLATLQPHPGPAPSAVAAGGGSVLILRGARQLAEDNSGDGGGREGGCRPTVDSSRRRRREMKRTPACRGQQPAAEGEKDSSPWRQEKRTSKVKRVGRMKQPVCSVHSSYKNPGDLQL
ncbi:hypothetical protein FKM82_010911 [Ascaphus truei]